MLTIVKYGFTLSGIFLFAVTLYQYQSTRSFIKRSLKANGTVVEFRKTKTYFPIVRFTSQAGREIEFTSSVGNNPAAYSKGQKIEVLYQPASPHDAQINDFSSLWLGVIIPGVIGVVHFLLGVGLIIWTNHKNETEITASSRRSS